MFGIPFIIQRFSASGVEREEIYLRTHRRGPAGEEMRKTLRRYHDAAIAQQRAAADAGIALGRAMNAGGENATEAVLQGIADTTDKASVAATESSRQQLLFAEILMEMALKDNYPQEKVDQIMDGITDAELHAVVGTIEQGAMPKDFFTSLDTRLSQSSTGRSGQSPVGSL